MSRKNFLNYNMLNINLQTILFFLEVADRGNMTIAANNLHVTQPFLSQRISSIESSINLKLFERKYHKMLLTEEGEILYRYWSSIINTYQESLDEARSLHDNKKRKISVGLWDNIFFHIQGKIANKLTSFNKDIKLNMNLFNLINAHSELANNHSDLIIMAEYENMDSNTAIETLEITHLKLYANINKVNPLSKEKELTLDKLKDELWLCTKTSKPFSYQIFMNKRCEKYGFQPQFLMTEDTAQQNFKLLFNEAISICPIVSMDPASEDIVSIKISDIYVPVVYAWKKDSRPEIKDFAEKTVPVIKEVFDYFSTPESIES